MNEEYLNALPWHVTATLPVAQRAEVSTLAGLALMVLGCLAGLICYRLWLATGAKLLNRFRNRKAVIAPGQFWVARGFGYQVNQVDDKAVRFRRINKDGTYMEGANEPARFRRVVRTLHRVDPLP